MEKTNFMDILKLVASIIICQFAGFIGSIFTRASIPTWYAGLTKPSFNPPNWVFAPVWTLLFLLMGISAYLVWQQGLENKDVRVSLLIFGIQLVLNVLWTFLFFGQRSPLYAFVEIIILWIAIALTIFFFLQISRTAGLLLLPYLLWVTFAAVLNFSILKLNP
jgi:benzodiazapine receptor